MKEGRSGSITERYHKEGLSGGGGEAATCDTDRFRWDAELAGEVRPGLVRVEIVEVSVEDHLEGYQGPKVGARGDRRRRG